MWHQMGVHANKLGASTAHNAGGRVLPLFSQQKFLTPEKSWQAWWQDDRRLLSGIVEGMHMFVTPIARLFNVADMCE